MTTRYTIGVIALGGMFLFLSPNFQDYLQQRKIINAVNDFLESSRQVV